MPKQLGFEIRRASLGGSRLRGLSHMMKAIRARSDHPKLTALDRTAFGILEATIRDNRRRIVELAEEKSLSIDGDICAQARSDLTNLRNRLAAEVAWLPGLSPKRADAYRVLLRLDLTRCMELVQQESPLVRANLYAAAIEMFDPLMDASYWSAVIEDIARQVDEIEPEAIVNLINEDRAVAGFTQIQGLDAVEAELSERRAYYRQTIKDAIDRMPTAQMVQVVTDVVASVTKSGSEHAPILVDELIDSFEIGARTFLDKEAENVKTLVKTINDSAPGGEGVIGSLLARLEQVLRNWDKVATPIQISMTARGIEHEQSRALAYTIRGLAVDLFNKHGMLEQAQRVTNLLQEVFSVLPEVADRVGEDAKAIDSIFKERDQAKHQTAQWEKEITYEAEIGLIFKDTLRISPHGIEWKGVRCPLESITGVGWGATRNSVNGIPSGTDYFIYYCDKSNVTRVQTNEQIYTIFMDKLWKAVGVRLLTEMLEGLRAGKGYQFGDAILWDQGMELTKRHTFQANERIHGKWSEFEVWSAEGSFFVGIKQDKGAYLSLPYQGANNAHLLEAAIRMKFKNGEARLSSVLKGN